MVVDSSAVFALLLDEPDLPLFRQTMLSNELLMSAGTRVEIGVVARKRLGSVGMERAERLLALYKVTFVDVDARQSELALQAMDRYGKGRGAPPAVLNYGDLFSYALAKALALPLLFKGRDFPATDVEPALP